MPRSTTISTRTAISTAVKSSNRTGLPPWPGGVSSLLEGRDRARSAISPAVELTMPPGPAEGPVVQLPRPQAARRALAGRPLPGRAPADADQRQREPGGAAGHPGGRAALTAGLRGMGRSGVDLSHVACPPAFGAGALGGWNSSVNQGERRGSNRPLSQSIVARMRAAFRRFR